MISHCSIVGRCSSLIVVHRWSLNRFVCTRKKPPNGFLFQHTFFRRGKIVPHSKEVILLSQVTSAERWQTVTGVRRDQKQCCLGSCETYLHSQEVNERRVSAEGWEGVRGVTDLSERSGYISQVSPLMYAPPAPEHYRPFYSSPWALFGQTHLHAALFLSAPRPAASWRCQWQRWAVESTVKEIDERRGVELKQ